MLRSRSLALCTFVWITADRLFANDPAPTQSTSPDGNGYHAAIPINSPFPDSSYGASHGGSTLSITYPFTSPFGNIDHSRGRFVYSCAAFYPRNSEGVFGIDVWLEQQDGGGGWSPVGQNGGLADNYGQAYQPINTPNPGPSPSYTFTWTFNGNRLPANTNFRVFVYVYIYNQGGSSQGDFPIYSTTNTVNTGSANDAPRISWSASGGTTNPTQVTIGQTYIISADGQDDNGNLIFVSINKNGQPFAYAGGGTGYSGNSQNPTSDSTGTVTYTAWANDASGAQSSTITRTVSVLGKANQSSVSSSNTTVQFWHPFTPSYFGGSGSGGWQFVVSSQSNWTGGNDSNTGTLLYPSNVWSSSWTPPAPGSYQFYVARDGDSNYNPSVAAGPYTLTVTAGNPVGSFDGIAPSSVIQGQTISGNGWAGSPQMGAPLSTVQIRIDGGANGTFSASLGGYRPDVQTANATWGQWSPHDFTSSGWSFSYNTASLAPGSHTFTAVAFDNNYGVSATVGTQSFSVSALSSQTVTISPTSQTITAGGTVNFTASGGQNGYIWGGAASGSGSSKSVTFPNVGTYSVTVYSPAGGTYAQSNTASATITVTAAGQTVSINPTSSAITASQSVTFSASGGNNGYVWGGSASGSGSSQTVTFPNPGSFNVTVYSPAGGNYAQSNTATATVTVSATGQTVAIAPTAQTVAAGSTINFTASGGQNGYVWGGAASGSGSPKSVTFPNVGTYSVTVYSPAGGSYAQSNTATANITVTPAGQTVAIVPTSPVINAGQSVTFSASGGNNGYVWGGSASGSGSSQTVTFPNPGSFNVTIYSPAGGNYAQSNTATATVTVNTNGQTVSLSPTAQTVSAGSTISFTASGGQNGYVWGGAASGSANPNSVTFTNVGSYNVTVYSPAGGAYAQSNTASATITVTPAGQNVGVSPNAPVITATQSVTFTASGGMNGYVWGGSASGTGVSQTVNFPAQGTFTVTVYSPAGGNYVQSNTASAAITVNGNSQTVSVAPSAPTITAGNSITFNATGGQNGYVWGGAASGNGAANTVSFPNVGSFSVTVYSPAGGIYAQSNTASASVTVSPATQTVVLAPAAPVINAGQSVVFSASGGVNGYVWGGSASGSGGSQTVSFPTAGNFTVTVYSPAGGNFAPSNTASAAVTVNSLPAPGTAAVTVKPQGGDVKVQNSRNRHNSQILVPK